MPSFKKPCYPGANLVMEQDRSIFKSRDKFVSKIVTDLATFRRAHLIDF